MGQVSKDFIHYMREFGLYPEGNQEVTDMLADNETFY